ncbi:oxidation resistance protein 1-like isoform X2 [Branchiostoma floridae]|uniref:Oxidation resistance protein 1 n=1 Tax=Branchiostoma floridae TaxID=7739 RepID=A0A9J7HKI6_BRAFL|nr:oxidation resistance protein 1-like isoform X2 [Branchiostoma floridae]
MATRMASREQKEEGELAASRKRRMFDLSRYRGMLQRGGTKQPSRFSQSVDMSGGPPVLPWETTGPDTAEGGKNWDAAKDKPADYPRKLSLDSQDVAKSPHEKKGARRTRSLPKPKGTSEYVVQKSDSLAGIALQFDTTPSELARLNKLPTRMVFPGMMLYVPDPDAWTDEETSVSSSPASPPPSPASTEIPSRRFDLPVVREKEPASQDPGHVTSPAQVVTPSSSRQSSLDELGSQKEDEFHEQFLKINVKYITAGKGTVSGILLVTPNAIMFDPHKSDPLVIETGCEEYGLICQMDTVLSAAMYHDIRPMMEPHKRDEIYKSGDYSQEETEPTSSSRSSCHGNGGAPLPGQRSESLEDEVFGGGGVPKPPAGPGVEVAQLVDLGDTIADGGGVVADSGGILVAEGSTEGSMEDSNVPKPQKFVEELVPIIEEKVDPNRLSPRVLSPDAGIDEETDTKGAGKGPPDTVADQVRKSGCSDASDTGSVESGIAEMVDSANQKDSVRPDNNGAISETSSSGQPGLPGVDPATDTATDGVNVQESLNFVDFSCGLFTTEANRSGVQDISEVIPQDSSVQEEIALLKDASKLSEPSEDSELRMTETVRERPTFLPSLTGSFDDLLPSQPQSLSSPQGPPLFLCLKVMQMKKSFTGGKEVVNPGSTKLPEYWFAIPKDRADHLYAFFLQWSPDVYGHEVNKADLEVSGFVVLGEETDSLEVVDDFYSSESSLYKDWEIVTAMEARRRLSMLEVEDSLPQPTLLGKSNLLDSKHVSLLAQFLPPRTEGYAWMLIYSTFEHGISLTTMYKKMVGVDSPVLLVVQDSENNVFGALTSSPVKISEHFYGTGESFLFTFFQDFKVYKWTGDNTFFIKGDKDCLAIGGGDGQFGLWLDEMLYHGRTHACTTFNNRLLTSQEDFTIKGLEAWGFEM